MFILCLCRDFLLRLPWTHGRSLAVDRLTMKIEGLGRRAEEPGDPGRACPLQSPGSQRDGNEKRTIGSRS